MARVLVVDDEPDLRELLRVALGMDGHQVSVAADGLRGLKAVQDQRPSLVILDVMMPGLDGWAVLQAIKADPDPALATTPVLMLTARAEDMDRIRGGIEGALHYLTKPFGIRKLRESVRETLAGAPEPEQRRAAQNDALVSLARLEGGSSEPRSSTNARPRLTRLEPAGRAVLSPQRHARLPAWLDAASLSERDREILRAVLATPTLDEARLRLGVSRSYLYASLRRIAAKCDLASGPVLVQSLRAANASHNGAWGP